MYLPRTSCLGMFAYAAVSHAAFWTVTSRYVEVLETTEPAVHPTGLFSSIGVVSDGALVPAATTSFTTTYPIAASATPSAPATSTSTYDDWYDNVEFVYVYYPQNAVNSADIVTATTTTRHNTQTVTSYLASVTYTAPASCTSHFTVATVTTLDVPDAVTGQLSATSVATVSSTGYDAKVTTTLSYYVAASAVPTLDPETDYYYEYYVAKCEVPPASGATGSTSGGSGGDDDLMVCSWYSCVRWHVWIIVIATVLPSLFVLGFVENFFWYRRLMRGRYAMRLGTVCWIMISLWVYCITARQAPRSAEAQEELCRRWDAMSAGDKWRNWWRWGFRHKYPVALLGDPAEDRKTENVAPAGVVEPEQKNLGSMV